MQLAVHVLQGDPIERSLWTQVYKILDFKKNVSISKNCKIAEFVLWK